MWDTIRHYEVRWAVRACTITPWSDAPHASPRCHLGQAHSLSLVMYISVNGVRTPMESLVDIVEKPVFAFYLGDQVNTFTFDCTVTCNDVYTVGRTVYELTKNDLLIASKDGLAFL